MLRIKKLKLKGMFSLLDWRTCKRTTKESGHSVVINMKKDLSNFCKSGGTFFCFLGYGLTMKTFDVAERLINNVSVFTSSSSLALSIFQKEQLQS